MHKPTAALTISAKFKALRHALKQWHLKLSTVKALISNCNKVILYFDELEEIRPLSWPEFNFRRIVKLHLQDILHWQYVYWKQRCTIRSIKVGEENSKKNHAMATERYRRNTISSIKNSAGEVVSDHQMLAGMFWSDFNQRMGHAKGIQMGFDLPNLIQRVDGLEDLSLPFTDSEVDAVIKNMPCDRAPGPDGFTGLFLKRCWSILKEDFMQLVNEFYEGRCNLECLNNSLITLVPKKLSPEVVGDFRPISLTNTCLKFLTKLLANRLQKVILRCIHRNQYGFLRCRSIQDCLAWFRIYSSMQSI